MPDEETDIFEIQADVSDRITSFVSNYNKTPRERITVGYLTARAIGLKELWTEFNINHKAIVAMIPRNERSTIEYFKANTFDKTEELYFDASGRIEQRLQGLIAIANPPPPQIAIAGPSSAIDPPRPPPQLNAHHIQIPRLNVPMFNGQYEEWQSFHDLYVAAVHSNHTIQPVHKLQYLKSLLKGEAELLLKAMPITDDNYEIAWRTLSDRYNNRRALINTHLQKLFTQQPADETATQIRQLLDNIKDCTNALTLQAIDITSWDCILVYVVSQYIPVTSLTLWEQSIPRNELPTFGGLLEFLENRFRILEFSPAPPQTNSSRSRQKSQTYHTSPSVCRLCQAPQHPLRLCPQFLNMPIQQRLNHVTKAKLCKNCFAFSHPTQACKSSGCCNVCGQRHHSLLHIETSSSAGNRATTPNSQQQPANPFAPRLENTSPEISSTSHTNALMSRPTGTPTDDILATALVTVAAFDGKLHSFRALLDNCSLENFVSKRVMQFLGLSPQPTSMIVSGVGQAAAPKPLGRVVFNIGSHYDSSFSMPVDAIVLPVITYNLPNKPVCVSPQLIDDLELADPSYGTPGRIDILLSARNFAALTLPAIRKNTSTDTIVLQTKLGWVLYGAATANAIQHPRSCFHVTVEDRISSTLQDFWKIEEVAAVSTLSLDDDKCERIFANTHRRDPDGRYRVYLPFKTDDVPKLGPSRDRAVSRFMQTERKLEKDAALRHEYAKCIQEYLKLGHMYPAITTEDEHRVCLPNGLVTYTSYYLPHHAVIKTDSTTTKLRVVFDASCKTLNGTSLNQTLLIGPTLQDTMFNLLLRWRTHRIVIKADVEKMYRQVLVDEIHQPYQRIVWRDNVNDQLQDFQLRTVTFGTAAAPYLAIKAIQQLANDEKARFPIGSLAIQNDFYVDDLLSGADSVADAIEKQNQVVNILRCGGFQIRKWSSNHTQVTSHLDDSDRELCSNSESTLKALGIRWCPRNDFLSIKVALRPDSVSTKRSLLSEVAKLFDPLGWIAPAIITMKILLQRIWLAGLSWDEPLPNAIQSDWNEFNSQLPSIEQIHIERWLKTTPNAQIQLHGFSDASEKAYAAAIYVRVRTPNADVEWSTHLVAAKTRVAPVKQVSLPRLELCAAALLAKLIVTVNASLKVATVYAWTDSEIVLAWLQGHPTRWTTFVGNRVSEIHSTLDATVWQHVPSKDNPADCASRGISPQQLVQHPIWWHGPTWLSKDHSHWPIKQKKQIAETTIECRPSQVFLTVPVNDTLSQILDNASSLTKAVRVLMCMRSWMRNTKSSGVRTSVKEVTISTNILLRFTQRTYCCDEYSALSSNQLISKKSKLLALNPFFDSDNLMRVGGRLQNADIPFSVRHPLIVPRKSRFTELIIDEAHEQTMHGGVALMLTVLRTQYWIIDARNTIRHRIHKCNTCFKYVNPATTQLMGNLPKPRVNASHPFSHTGLDYAGPISIRVRRQPGRPTFSKGYICLFVCLATKAIHLELVGDMSAATFLAAFHRFSSRRGTPSDMYSDNGTYFVRAAHDIDQDMRKVRKECPVEVAKMVAQRAVQWHFIPPAAPHFGGLWEAGVKSTKHHLKRVIGDGSLTYEEMSTTLCQIERCLNSRPLCPISNDPDDFEILTPGHFLIGRPLLARSQPSLLHVPENRLDHWQRIYQNTERFWQQWQSEYFARLQQRPKWLAENVNLQKGELVLLKEDNLPPAQWKLARIIETHQGADGLTRVVTVKTPTTILKRPITKLCKLPTQ